MGDKDKKKIKVFIVEDDPMYQKALARNLSSLGLDLDIKCYSTGEECIENILEIPDIVILDYFLSTEKIAFNGMAVLKEIKTISPSTHVIVLSANDTLDIALESIREGAYEYLVKSDTAFVRLESKIKAIMLLKDMKEVLNKSRRKTNLALTFVCLLLLSYFVSKMFLK